MTGCDQEGSAFLDGDLVQSASEKAWRDMGGGVREAGSDSRKLMGSTHQNLYFLPVGQRRSSSETAKDVSQGEHL